MKLAVEFAQMRKVSESMFEVPILRETQILDKSRMGGDGKGSHKIDAAMLHEIAANFSKWPLPVPASAGDHKSLVQRGNEAAAAFIESVFVDGPNLWARIKINDPKLRAELENDGWRGFSVEIVQDFKLPTVEMKGWALRGGVFTNIPATPTLFKQIAASIGTEGSDEESNNRAFAHSELRPQRLDKEREMSAEKVAQLEASIAEKDGKIEARDSKIAELTATVAELTAKSEAEKTAKDATIGELQASIADLTKEVAKDRVERLNADVTKVIEDAIDAGVAPVCFTGHDAKDITPGAWMSARFKSLNTFKEFVANLPKSASAVTTSGDAPEDGGDSEALTISDEARQSLINAGLDPDSILKDDPDQNYGKTEKE